MLTWQLWRALTHPPRRHPLFERGLHTSLIHNRLIQTLKVTLLYLGACLLISLIWPLLLVNAGLVAILLIAAGNTVHNMRWASVISAVIAQEREQATYDLLAVLPPGALGVGWTLSTARLHSSSLFRAARLFIHSLAMALVGACLTAMLIPFIILLAPGSPAAFGLFLLLVYGISLAAAGYLHYIQSLTLAVLIGMVVPAYAPGRLNAQLWSTSGFLLVQISLYLLTLIAGFVILPGILDRFTTIHPALQVSLPLLRLGIFYALHEAAIAITWQMLKRQFSAHPSELDLILRPAGY